MKFFEKISAIVSGERRADMRLGIPAADTYQLARRMTAFSNMRGGRGFRVPEKAPAKRANGLTRGEVKRAIAASARDRVSEYRPEKYRHASAALAA